MLKLLWDSIWTGLESPFLCVNAETFPCTPPDAVYWVLCCVPWSILSITKGERKGFSFIFLCVATKLNQHHLSKMLFFFLQCVLLTIGVWAYICLFKSIPLINVTVFIPIPFCFYYYSSLIQLEFKNGDTSSTLSFRIVLTFVGLLLLHEILFLVP